MVTKLVVLIAIIFLGDTFKQDNSDCYLKGYKLFGRVQIVESFPDLKVQIVTSFPDLKVKIVDSNAAKCGEWKMVENFPDLKIQMVNSFPDLKIQFVEAFPGLTRKD